MSRKIKSLSDVIEKQLCSGCGVCSYLEPDRYYMADTLEYGRRPFLKIDAVHESGEGLSACPGIKLSINKSIQRQVDISKELLDGWGPVLGVWEGYANDSEIRFSGSSGGAASAISLFCLEKMDMGGVLHTAARKDIPYLNQTVFSKSRNDILSTTGSRYSPSSPCDGLNLIEQSPSECVFIGKPCDVAGVANARSLHATLDHKIGLTIAFFCAGVPSTKGTLDLLSRLGVNNPEFVNSVRYRGNGWPGLWTVGYKAESGENKIEQMSYSESWGFLQKYRQWRCYICPDHSGEFSDIAVGDPWYRSVQPGEPGKSLIVARSKRGFDIITAAHNAGYITLETFDLSLLPRSQPNLMDARGALWARLWVSRLFGAATPEFIGFPMFKYWIRNLSLREKLRSIFGTAKRVYIKRLNKRIRVQEWSPDHSQ